MSFGHPWLLLALAAVPVAAFGLVRLTRRRARYTVAFTNLDVLAAVQQSPRWRRYLPIALFLASLAALCVGVARPYARTLVTTDRATVILVVDESGSMFATDVRPSRLQAAQEAVRVFLERVPRRVRVGLVVFAGEPQVSAPPTTDRRLVREAIDTLGAFPFPGTAIGDAVAAAVRLGKQATQLPGSPEATAPDPAPPAGARARKAPPVAVLFLSDGSQTRGALQPLEGAARAKAAGIPVYTIALGTPEGTITRSFGGFTRTIPVPPDPQTLAAIAEETGGKFFDARSSEALRSAYEHLGSTLGREPGRTEVTYAFLGAAAALLVAAGLLGAIWAPRLP